MMKKFLTAILIATITASVNAETMTIQPVPTGLEERFEAGLEQAKIIALACKDAGLSQKETLRLVAEQLEKKALSDNQETYSTETNLVIAITIVAVLGAAGYIVWKNWFSTKSDTKNKKSKKKKQVHFKNPLVDKINSQSLEKNSNQESLMRFSIKNGPIWEEVVIPKELKSSAERISYMVTNFPNTKIREIKN